MKSLITGCGGFMGVHLANYLLAQGHEVLATFYNPEKKVEGIDGKVTLEECDMRNKNQVFSAIKRFQPDKIFHLAAQSYPKVSWENPQYTIEVNILGTVNLFEAVKKHTLQCKILNAGSSAEYGFVSEAEVPVKENHSLMPLHPYGVSKVAQELLAYQYFRNFNLKPVTFRIFNTTGPGKVNDVCSDLTKRLVEIEKRINPDKKLRVGNLNSKRAITDVRDLIKAFDLGLEKTTIGEVYNVSGEKVYEIGEIIEILRDSVEFEFGILQDPSLMRSTDEPIIYGDSSKFKAETGWTQKIPLEKTLEDMLNYWRARI